MFQQDVTLNFGAALRFMTVIGHRRSPCHTRAGVPLRGNKRLRLIQPGAEHACAMACRSHDKSATMLVVLIRAAD
jgi:hypothetical protein